MKAYRFKGAEARQRREDMGLTAQEVAALAGVSESAICAFERTTDPRQPRGVVYRKICEALGIEDLDELRVPLEATSLRDTA